MKALAALITVLWIALAPLSAPAQSLKEARSLFEQAEQLKNDARSPADLKKAMEMFEQAMRISQSLGHEPSMAGIYASMGDVHERFHEYDKAMALFEKSLEINRRLGNQRGEERVLERIAGIYVERGKYDQAIEMLQKCLSFCRKTNDARGESKNLHEIGDIYEHWGQFDKAAEHYEKALAINRKIGNARSEGINLACLGDVWKNRGQYDKAIGFYQQSLVICRKIGNVQGEGVNLASLGDAYRHLCQYDKAMEYYEQSLAILRKVGAVRSEAAILGSVGLVYSDRGQHGKALESHEKALILVRKIGSLKGEGATLNNMGLAAARLSQYDKAIELYEQSLTIKRKLGESDGESTVLNNLGVVCADRSQYEKALENLQKALDIVRRSGAVEGEATTLNNMSLVYNRWGKYDKATECLDKALEINKRIGNASGEATAMGNLADIYSKTGQYSKAEELSHNAIAILRKIGNTGKESIAINNLAGVYNHWAKYDKAMELYEKSLEMRQRTGDVHGEAVVCNNIGLVHKERGQHAKALEFYNKALTTARQLGDPSLEALTIGNLGVLYENWGQHNKALEFYEISLAMNRKLGNAREEGGRLNDLAGLYLYWGQYEKAAEIFEQSLAICRKIGDLRGQGNNLRELGFIFVLRGEPDRAMANFQQCLEMFAQMAVSTDWVKNLIGNLYIDLGQIDKAEPILKEVGDNQFVARLHLVKSEYDQAKSCYDQVVSEGLKTGSPIELFIGYTGLGQSLEAMKDYRSAADNYAKAIKVLEDLRSTLTADQRKQFFDVRNRGLSRTAPYEGLARTLLKLDRPAEAWNSSEYTKARLFSEAMSRRSESTRVDVPAEVAKADQEINDQMAALRNNKQKAYEKGDKLALETLEPQVKKLENEFADHKKMLRQKSPLFASTKYPEPMDLAQTALRPDEWVLAYHVTDTGLIVYLSKGKLLKKALFKPIARKELDGLVKAFRAPLDIKPEDKLADKLASFDFSSGRKLADVLLADVLPELPQGTPLTIVPADCLGVLPFEMLVLNDGGSIVTSRGIPNTTGAEFFGDRNPIAYAQSVTALTLARNFGKQKGASERIMVMADPIFSTDDPRVQKMARSHKQELLDGLTKQLIMSAQTESGLSWPRLAGTAKIADSLKKANPGSADVYQGAEAAKARFMKADLSPYRSIVFATHGYAGTDLGGIKEPVLVLTLVNQPQGQDGFLRLSEVMGLKMNCDVVALTACQTGLGKQVSGEGTMGMGRAFQYAGAKSVLMSLWSVSESTSVNLVENFFKYAKDGKNKLEALSLARNDVRKTGYDHPFFWAPFILVGDAE